jgi:DNA-binding CsgD family transcriptional regulator
VHIPRAVQEETLGLRPVDIYDEEKVSAITAEMARAISAAQYGNVSWNEVPAILGRAFPGSFTALQNLNFTEARPDFVSLQNMDPAFMQSYIEHFVNINPWSSLWLSAKSGTVAISEDVAPARTIAHTEFYNDWLAPQKVDASVGMKILGGHGEVVNTLMHFPIALADTYNRAAAEVMRRVHGDFVRSIHVGHMMRAEMERVSAAAALVERSKCAAFVIDGGRFLREANQAAVDLFHSGRLVAVRNHRCLLLNKDANARFENALARLSEGLPTNETCIICRTETDAWQIVLAPVPVPPASWDALSPRPRQLVLVLIVELTLDRQTAGDFSGLSRSFGLTPAEIKLCKCLFLGESMSEASEHLGISVETVRGRVKTILQKTGTARQGQLMLLLSKLL